MPSPFLSIVFTLALASCSVGVQPDPPSAPEPPSAPSAPEPPEAPEAPDAPEAPEAPEAPSAPEAPQAPSAPKAPSAPEAPGDDSHHHDHLHHDHLHHEDPRIDHLLKRIEHRRHELMTLTADLTYQKEEALLGRREVRSGTMVYEASTEDTPERLAVLFDQLIVNNVRRQRKREYIFDGTWLTEFDYQRKSIIRRQLAPEGQVVAASGPVPMMIYRSREDLLRLYTISLCAPEKHDWIHSFAKESHPVFCLRFEPRPGNSQAGEIAWIDVVFDDNKLLPEGIAEESVNGDRKLVRLKHVQRNVELDAAMQQKLSEGVPDPLPEGWTLHVEPLQASTPVEYE